MNFTLSEDHEALRDVARSFLSKEASLGKLLVPGATVEQAGYEKIWPKIVDLGWPGIVIPEIYGGLGMTYIDLAMIIGEMGRVLAPAPLFGTIAGAWAIERTGSDAQKQTMLSAVAGGELKLALAVSDADGSIEGPKSDASATSRDGVWSISGTRSFVVDAKAADRIVVLAQTVGGSRFFVVDGGAVGLSVDLVDWRDITRQVCTIRFDDVAAELLSESDDGAWSWIRDRLYFMLATESAAGIQKVLADAVDYAKERVAFGRPIGAFQALKHQLAEIAGISECSTAAVHYAAWALTEGDAKASLACAMAQSYTSEGYREATHRNIQIFGAIGFTWEMQNHLYYKRARCNAELFGAPRDQREQIICMLEADGTLIAA